MTGTLYLRTGVTLEIDGSAVLSASPDIEDYGTDTHHNRYRNEPELDRCLIFAEDVRNVTVCGHGTICGNAECFPNDGSIYRPMMFRFLRCEGIHLENLKLYDAAAWTTAFLDSRYIWARGLDIRNEKRFNGDGLDFDGCSHVYVSDCNIRGTDDNLCLQAGSRAYPTEDIHITNCSFSSVCAGIRIGLKSIGDIRNVVISNCTMREIWREGVKIECSEGGRIEDILIQNVSMRDVRRPFFLILNNRYEPDGLGSSVELKEMPEIGVMDRIRIDGVHAVDDESMNQIHYRLGTDIMGRPEFAGVRVDAEENHPIGHLTIRDFYYRFVGGVTRERAYMGERMLWKGDHGPCGYPKVLDRLKFPEEEVSENYYPDWSRAAFLDIRNVSGLTMEEICLESILPDEREETVIENVTAQARSAYGNG